MLVVLIHPLLITCAPHSSRRTGWGPKTVANPGPHGFSEILYEFTSASANNGSGFEGLSDNNPPGNIGPGSCSTRRFPALLLPIASLAPSARKSDTANVGDLVNQYLHLPPCYWERAPGRCTSFSGVVLGQLPISVGGGACCAQSP